MKARDQKSLLPSGPWSGRTVQTERVSEFPFEAERMGFQVMVGCMVATSLSMAPAMILAQHADLVDLDGPLWLAEDRAHGLHYDGSTIYPPESNLWG